MKSFHQKVEELALGIGDLLLVGSEVHGGHPISLISGLMIERFDLVELEGESLTINELRIVGFFLVVSIGSCDGHDRFGWLESSPRSSKPPAPTSGPN